MMPNITLSINIVVKSIATIIGSPGDKCIRANITDVKDYSIVRFHDPFEATLYQASKSDFFPQGKNEQC